MTVWMYYETDGDAGFYAIKLFMSRVDAEAYKHKINDAYGHVDGIWVEKPK